MRSGFGFTQAAKDRQRVCAAAIGERTGFDDFLNMRQMAMFLLFGGQDGELRGGNTATFGLVAAELRAQVQALESSLQTIPGGTGVQESAHRHIAADAGERVEVAKFH